MAQIVVDETFSQQLSARIQARCGFNVSVINYGGECDMSSNVKIFSPIETQRAELATIIRQETGLEEQPLILFRQIRGIDCDCTPQDRVVFDRYNHDNSQFNKTCFTNMTHSQ